MLSISNPIIGARGVEYCLSLAREAYYTEGGEPPGRWAGGLARDWGLEGKLDPAVLRKLFAGYSPDGSTPLVQNAGDPKRRCGWDLTFSAPKSVSVLWSQSAPEVRAILEEAHWESVVETLTQVEEIAAYTRTGKGGKVWERTKILAAVFEHGTTRAQDPGLHSHALVLNLARRADGSTGALVSKKFFELKLALGAHYQATLATKLQSRLGLGITWKEKTFALRDVPQSLCVEFSKRRNTMMEVFAKTGGYSAVAAKTVALMTRPEKTHAPRAELFPMWQAVGQKFGWGTGEAQALVVRDNVEKLRTSHLQAQAAEMKLNGGQKSTEPGARQRDAARDKQVIQNDSDGLKPDLNEASLRTEPEVKTTPGDKGLKKASPSADSDPRLVKQPGDPMRDQPALKSDARKIGSDQNIALDSTKESERENRESSRRGKTGGKARADEYHERAGRHSKSEPSRAKNPETHRAAAAARREFRSRMCRMVPLEVRTMYPFWQAQSWNPARSTSLRYLSLKLPKRKPDTVLGEKKVPFARLQLRKGQLFRDAPSWSPASKLDVYRVAVLWNAVEKRKAKLKARYEAAKFRKGQTVRFEREDKVLAIKAGQTATVVKPGRASVTVSFEDATRRTIQLSEYHQITIVKARKEQTRRHDRTRNQEGGKRDKSKEEQERRAKAEKQRQDREAEAKKRREEERKRQEEERKRREEEMRRQQSQTRSYSR